MLIACLAMQVAQAEDKTHIYINAQAQGARAGIDGARLEQTVETLLKEAGYTAIQRYSNANQLEVMKSSGYYLELLPTSSVGGKRTFAGIGIPAIYGYMCVTASGETFDLALGATNVVYAFSNAEDFDAGFEKVVDLTARDAIALALQHLKRDPELPRKCQKLDKLPGAPAVPKAEAPAKEKTVTKSRK